MAASEDKLGGMVLEVQGLGILLYSPFAAAGILEGQDYLERFTTAEQILPHIYRGTLVAFGTGSSGTYRLEFLTGYPEEEAIAAAEFKLRLGIEIRDQTLCVRDLYDLLDWTRGCPPEQQLSVPDGFYHLTLYGGRPASGVLGDDQRIHLYLQPLESMPKLKFGGVPTLCR